MLEPNRMETLSHLGEEARESELFSWELLLLLLLFINSCARVFILQHSTEMIEWRGEEEKEEDICKRAYAHEQPN